MADGSSVSATDLLTDYRTANGDPSGATIMGIRLQYWAQFVDTAISSATDHNLWIGIIKGDYEVSADVPFPIISGDVQHRDWMYLELSKPHISHTSTGSSASSTGTVSGDVEPPYREIKARRRLDELNETLWLVAQRETADTGLTIDFQYHASVMLLLP